jgi:hypothetical protein
VIRLPQTLAAVICLVAPLAAAGESTPSRFAIVEGVAADGAPTPLWIAVLERRGVDPAAADAQTRRPFTDAERAWIERIRGALPALEEELERLSRPFQPVTLPAAVAVVVGNRGASDAFTHDAATIGFDLAVLRREYGDAASAENADRIARLLRHETIHLLQKARPDLATKLDTPLRRAVAECWSEGHGNLESLSARWRNADGTLTATALETLDRLAPRFVARLTALACASPEAERELTRDLSNGPFVEKWGALPVALWLAREGATSPAALDDYVAKGPAAVWALSARNLAPELARALAEARAAADAGCGTRGR